MVGATAVQYLIGTHDSHEIGSGGLQKVEELVRSSPFPDRSHQSGTVW